MHDGAGVYFFSMMHIQVKYVKSVLVNAFADVVVQIFAAA